MTVLTAVISFSSCVGSPNTTTDPAKFVTFGLQLQHFKRLRYTRVFRNPKDMIFNTVKTTDTPLVILSYYYNWLAVYVFVCLRVPPFNPHSSNHLQTCPSKGSGGRPLHMVFVISDFCHCIWFLMLNKYSAILLFTFEPFIRESGTIVTRN